MLSAAEGTSHLAQLQQKTDFFRAQPECDLCGGPVARGRQIYGRVGKIHLHSDSGVLNLFFGSQSKQAKQPLTEEIHLLSEATTYIYFLIEIDEKDTKLSLFYLMHPANSNSHKNRVFSQDLSAFLLNF